MLNHPAHVTLTSWIFLRIFTSGRYHRDKMKTDENRNQIVKIKIVKTEIKIVKTDLL